MTDETLEKARRIFADNSNCGIGICPKFLDGEKCTCFEAARQIIELAQRQEREGCAEIAESPAIWKKFEGDFEGNCIAAAIRARAIPSPDDDASPLPPPGGIS